MPLDFRHDASCDGPALCPIAEVGVEAPDFVRRSSNRAFGQVGDVFLKHLIGREPDRILEVFCFQI